MLLDRGEVYYNDRKMPLSADLHDLTFRSSYDGANGGRYYGTLSYRDGHLQYGTYAPVPHDSGGAVRRAARAAWRLSKVTLKVGQSQLLLNASLDNYSSPHVHANYVVMLALAELRRHHEESVAAGGHGAGERQCRLHRYSRAAGIADDIAGRHDSEPVAAGAHTAAQHRHPRPGRELHAGEGNAELRNITRAPAWRLAEGYGDGSRCDRQAAGTCRRGGAGNLAGRPEARGQLCGIEAGDHRRLRQRQLRCRRGPATSTTFR